MLSFISFWRAAAIVLCDMASTAWYVGGIAETAIGAAAPSFIAAVMLFSACGLAIALGHAFLGMSGVESLAQVYREMEAPKLQNLRKAALMIFLVAFTLTT